MKTPVLHLVFLALLSSFLTPPAFAHQPSSPTDSTHFQPFDYEQWERERALRPAAKRLQDLNVGEPRTVRLFYFLPKDRTERPEVVEAMKTGIVELQTFFAEQMEAHGHGRKTFQLEADDQGEPIVHHVDGDYPDSHYSTRGYTEGEIDRAFDNSANVAIIVMDLSSGGSIAGQGTGSKSSGWLIVYEGWNWPYVAHELGHAFGLHHDFRDRAYILSYGRPNRSSAKLSACAAEFLAVHPYFNPNNPLENESPPTVELTSSSEYPPGSESVPVRLRVRDDNGLHQVILFVHPKNPFLGGTPEVKVCRGLAGETDTVVEFNFDGRLPSDNVGTAPAAHTTLSNTSQHPIYVVAVDMDGNRTNTAGPISFRLKEGHSPQHITTIDRQGGGYFRSAAFSPDGTTLAIGTGGGVFLYNASTTGYITFLRHTEGNIYSNHSVVFSPDGTLLASGSADGTIKLWNVATKENIATFEGHTGRIYSVDFSPDGTLLASSSTDRTIKLWNVATKENTATLEGHTKAVTSVKFLPDGTLASSSTDGTVKLWDVTTKAQIATLETGHTQPSGVAFSPDGTTLASSNRYTSKLWNVATRTQIATLEYTSGNYTFQSLVFSPDGTILASSGGGRVQIWDVLTRENIATFSGGPGGVGRLLFSPNGTKLISQSGGAVKFWDVSEWSGQVDDTLETIPVPAISDRTPQVRDAILDAVRLDSPTISNYASITVYHLARITRLSLDDTNINSLKADDFDGLNSLTTLSLTNNQLTTLPEGIFDGLTALTWLSLRYNRFTMLPAGIFDGLTALTWLSLSNNQLNTLPEGIFDNLSALTWFESYRNQLTTLPAGIFDNLTALTRLDLRFNRFTMLPEGIFDGLSSLTTLPLYGNAVNPLPLTVSLEKVGTDQIKAVAPTGAPFDIILPLSVTNGTINGGASSVTIPQGSLESQPLTATRTPGTTAAVTVDIGTLPGLPTNHSGYALTKSADLPLEIWERESTLVCDRTPQVRDAIVAAVPGVSTCGDVTGAHLAAITELELEGQSIPALQVGDFDGLTALTTLDLDNNQLASLPEGIFDNLNALTTLHLQSNQLSSLPAGIFDNLNTLTTLHLQSNQLSSLPADLFDGLTALTTLHLQSNQLSSLPADLFDGVTALTTLHLQSNQLSSLPAGIFDNLNTLTTLHLQSNQLSSLPADLFDGLTALTTLHLQSNHLLSSLPADLFDGVTALTTLHLQSNQLSSLPADLFDGLTALTTLHLQSNAVNALPLTVSLEKVGEGQFKAVAPTGAPFELVLPVSVSGPGAIEGGATTITIPIGSLESTPLTVPRTPGTTAAVTVDIGNLPSLPPVEHEGYSLVKSEDLPLLVWEDITGICDRTPQVRDAIVAAVSNVSTCGDVRGGHLAAIYSLNLPDKSITSLKADDFDGLTRLTWLYLRSNQLSSLPAGIFDNLTALRTLDLFSNQLSSLPAGIFDNLTALTQLYLHNNQLTALPAGLFDTLTNLTDLYLSSNQLSSLPAGLFDNLNALTRLDLFGNQLSSLPEGIFDGLTALTSLGLQSNSVRPLPLTVSLEKVGEGQFKAVAPTGAPFDIVLPFNVMNGTINGGASSVTIPKGSLESQPLTATRTPGTTAAVTVDIGTLPGLPTNHSGYALVKSTDLPLEIWARESIPVCDRTPQVRDAIVAAVSGVSACGDVTGAHLAAITELELEGQSIPALQVGDFDGLTALTSLDLDNNQLASLPVGIFDTLTNLIHLYLTDNQLTALPVGAFDNLGVLETLYLTNNQLTALPVGIDNLTTLTRLALNSNQLTALPEGVFDKLTALTTLNLDNNQLTALPVGIFDNLINLTQLNLDNNQLTALPEGIFGNLNALTTLHLDGNQLTSLPEGTFDGISLLTTLTLYNGPVDPLPLMVSLEKVGEDQVKAVAPSGVPFDMVLPLSVTSGSISGGATTITIPVGSVESQPLTVMRTPSTTAAVTVDIGTLPGLPSNHQGYAPVKSADLPLTVIDPLAGAITPVCDRTPQVRDAIVAAAPVSACGDVTEAHLAAITRLDLHDKNITTLKEGDFSGLSSLERLVLESNQLATLPSGIFDGLTALTWLDLGPNQFTTLPEGIFDGLTALTWLDLGPNQFTTLPEDIFDGLTALTTLDLSNNQFTTLPEDLFDGLTALRTLALHYNQLTTLPAGIFDRLSSLNLGLYGNQLTVLPEGLFSGLSSLTSLSLSLNAVDPLPLTVSLEKVGEGQFKGVAPAGAPFDIVLPLTVANGSISGGATTITIPTGSIESEPLTVIRTPGTTFVVTVDIGTLPSRPSVHGGYELVKSADLPLVLTEFGGTVLTPVCDRTPQVRNAIVAAVSGVSNCRNVTEAHLAAITLLDLRSRNITTLKAGDFDGLSSLGSLQLGNNQLSSLPADLFSGLTALGWLDLRRNQLTTLPDKVFSGLTALGSLGLGGNNLTSLPPGVFSGLTALWELHLYENNLTSLPAGVFSGLTALRTINLGGNNLTSLPLGVFSGLSSLRRLWLDSQPVSLPVTVSLEKVGEDQFKATVHTGAPFEIVLPLSVANGSISSGTSTITIPIGSVESETLTVARTPVSTFAVTVDIGTLPELPEGEHLGYTLVKSADLPLAVIDPLAGAPTPVCDRTPQVRDEIVRVVQGVSTCGDVTEAHLASIEGLYPQKKMITALKTEDFDGLPSLTELSLRGNQLSSLPEDVFSGLSALTRLDLDDNQLSSLPEDVFSGLSSLSGLNLYDNQLSSLPAGLFSGLSSLSGLDLADNQLSSLPAGVFSGLSSLSGLDLRNNQLSSLPAGVFSGLSSLTSLWLFDNQLSSLPEDVFSGLSRLSLLGLQNNQLSSLPARVFSGLSSLELLQLQGNSSLLPLTVSLERVGETQFKATVHTGAPFTIVLPLSVSNGSIDGGATTITIPIGSVESEPLTVSRTPSTTFAVTVDIGTLPGLPTNQDSDGRFHQGYALAKSAGLPIVFTELGGAVFTSVCDRTPQVRDAIVAAVSGVSNCRNVTEAHLAAITILDLQRKGITALKAGDFDGLNSLIRLWLRYNELSTLPVGIFDGLTSLTTLYLNSNALTSLPAGIFDGLTELRDLHLSDNALTSLPAGIFDGLTELRLIWLSSNALTSLPAGIFDGLTEPLIELVLSGNAVNPLPLTVSLEKVGTNQFKAVAPSGVPFDIVLPLTITNGSITGGASTLTIPVGSVESEPLTVTRTPGTTFAVTVNIGDPLPVLSGRHQGYALVKSADLPLEIFSLLAGGICDRTPQVQTAILGALQSQTPSPSTCGEVTEAHLATGITSLFLNGQSITALQADDFAGLTGLTELRLYDNQLTTLPADLFDGLTALTTLYLNGNQLSTLPEGLFDGLSSLATLYLYGNSVDPLPLTVSLEKVGTDQVKAVAPAGAPFDLVLPLTVTNGSISGGATSITIPAGSLESQPLTVTRTPSTTAAVTMDIGTLPRPPTNHSGYTLVKSTDLPLEIISATTPNTAAVNIPDANLRTKVETALGKASGDPISAAEMATLTALAAQDASISDLTGLETATNLTELQLWDNNIADMAAVAGLTKLTKLYLWGNAITDISHVAALTNLTHLRLGENSIANVSAVAALTNLTHLYLRENSVSDIAAVAGLTNLTELRIGDNTISSIAAVANLTKLVWLDAPNNSISDIAAVTNLTSLTSLTMSGNSITDLSAVAGLTDLLELYLAENAVSDLSPLVSNTGLGENTEIDVLGNPLSYPSIYTHIPALQARSVFIEFDNRTPTTLAKVSGDSQQGTPETALAQPFVVEVQDANSVAFAGVPVTFAVTAGGGTLSATSTTTDANGRAASTLTLGNSAGTNTVQVSVQGISQTATFTAEATTTDTAVDEGTEVTTYNVGDTIPLPTGFQTARLTIGSGRTITAANGTYTCVGAVNCIIANGAVTQGTIEVTTGEASSSRDETPVVSALTPVCDRTPQVRDAIVAAVPSVSDCNNVTEAHLAAITGTLSLLGESITALAAGDFAGLTALENLNLRLNRLTTLPAGVFDELTALTALDLQSNDLTTLPAGVFDGLTALTGLDLQSNALTTLPAGVFDGLTALELLLLGSNDLTTLPAGVFDGLTALTGLDLSDNPGAPFAPKAVALPDDGTIPVAGGTVTLDGSGSGGPWGTNVTYGWALTSPASGVTVTFDDDTSATPVVTIPALTEGTELTFTLTVTAVPSGATGTAPAPDTATVTATASTSTAGICGRTSQVQTAILAVLQSQTPSPSTCGEVTEAHLAAITSLSLSGRSITALKAGDFAGLTALTVLDLWDNELSSLPAGIFDNLTALTTLYLQNNQLSSLPVGIGRLTALTTLDLSHNELSSLPAGIFGNLTALTDLRLLENQLSSLPTGIGELTALTYLQLGGNNFTTLPTGIFDKLSNLRQLYLGSTELSSLPAGIFDNLIALTTLLLVGTELSSLPAGIFDNLTALEELTLANNQFTTLPAGIFDNLTALTTLNLSFNQLTTLPAGIFDNLTALLTLRLHRNSVDPLSLTVSLEKVGADQVKAVAPSGAPFNLVLPLTVTNGSISGGTTTLTISKGSVESAPLTVTRTSGTTAAVTVDIGTLPGLPTNHSGYALVKSDDLPLEIFSLLAGGICDRTSQVQTAILAGLQAQNPSPSTCAEVTAAHLATGITSLFLNGQSLTALQADDFEGLTSLQELRLYDNQLTTLPDGLFDGLTALTTLYLNGNQLSTLPDGLFDGLSALTTLYLYGNSVDPLPLTVSLQKVGADQVKAVALSGAPFEIVLPLTVANGNISGGATTITIPAGSLESQPLTATRTPSTTAAVTMDIGTLPRPPTNHSGYELVKSADLPLEVISATTPNTAAVNIPDANLRANIETALGKTSGDPISAAEMATLTSLAAQDAAISDLTGLETATNLTELQLWDNAISNISAVAGLTNLTKLYLWGNTITDISHVAGLTNLTHLRLGENSIANVSAVAALTNLTHLYLRENSVSDIAAVAGLTNLTELRIGDNTISSIAAVANLTKLVWLDAPNNSISDIAAVANLTNLTSLNLSGNSISDLSAVAGLTDLLELYLAENAVSDLSPLVSNTGLGENTEIDVQGNPLSYPSIYTHIPALQARSIFIEFDNRTPTTLAKVSGDSQQGTSGTALAQPFVVEVQDANSGAFVGVPVTFAITAGGGTLSATSTTTDANGRAASTLTLGNSAGTNTVQVSVQGISQTATFTAEATTTNTEPVSALIPVCDRTPQVRDAILGEISSISDCAQVTEAHLAAITTLRLNVQSITALQAGDFDGLTALQELYLSNNQLTSLPEGVFSGLSALTTLNLTRNQLSSLPAGIFDNLNALTTLNLSGNQFTTLPAGIFDNLNALTRLYLAANQLSSLPAGIFDNLNALTGLDLGINSVVPLPLTVSLEKVGEGQFKATAPAGAPFDIALPLTVVDGTITGGANSITIRAGRVESDVFTVTRTPGTTSTVTVDIGTLPGLPANHLGYALVKSPDLPLEVISTPTDGTVCRAGDVLAPGESCTYPGTEATFSVLDDGKAQLDIPGAPAWFNNISIGGSLRISATINDERYLFIAEALASGSWEIKEVGDSGDQQPEQPEEPGNEEGTPTLSISTASSLTEATLHESVVTLSLSGGTYERSIFDIRDAVTVSGIPGVTVGTFGVRRVSDTEVTVELEFDGTDFDTDATLTYSVGADAIANYNGPLLTAQIPVTANTEVADDTGVTTPVPEDSGDQAPDPPEQPDEPIGEGGTPILSISTASPLTEATLHESVVTLTLSGGVYDNNWNYVSRSVTVSGIAGVTFRRHNVDRVSDTVGTVELEFEGDIDSDATLTFTVGADAIANYNGLPFTVQIPVTANTESVVASTTSPLTEATLHESVVTLTLSGRAYHINWNYVSRSVTVSGIAGVTFRGHNVDRVSDTQVTVELDFNGNIDTDATLTFTVGADAIANYNGPPLTAQIPVTANTESVVASTASPLTEATLHESVVTLTLSGGAYERSIFKIRGAVEVSGIAGVTVGTFGIDRISDTEITVELEFNGTDFDTDATLTFTVGADAIANYNGPALTTQIPVTAIRENALVANFPNPFNPETWISYQLAAPAEVALTIYALNGQVVRRLALGHQSAGTYAAYWDGRSEFGKPVASGVYFYRLTAGNFTATRKMLIQK